MKDQKISLPTAKLANEKGFEILGNQAGFIMNKPEVLNLPSQTILQKWLREVHQIYVDIKFKPNSINSHKVTITKIVNESEWWSNGEIIKSWKVVYQKSFSYKDSKYEFNIKEYDDEKYKVETFTWEEALEEGLFEALKLIK